MTGGSRGIGAAVAVRLASQGADVALTYMTNADAADDVVDRVKDLGRRAHAVHADNADAVALADAINQAADLFGRLDILVNNAGAYTVGPIDELGDDALDATIAVNIRAPFVAARTAARHLTDGGRIVSIGSNMAERVPFPGMALYSMSKTALVGLTRSLARELGPRGITVNLVNPGPTDTDSNPADGPYAGTISGFTALGRYAGADEIAATVAFLATDDARYLTGATVNVDGGFTA